MGYLMVSWGTKRTGCLMEGKAISNTAQPMQLLPLSGVIVRQKHFHYPPLGLWLLTERLNDVLRTASKVSGLAICKRTTPLGAHMIDESTQHMER